MKINFKAAFDTVMKFSDEHKPEIATGVGIVLMVAGAVGAVCATVKTMQAVADAKEDKLLEIAADTEEYENLSQEEKDEYDYILDNPLPFKEAVKVSWKYWVAPIVAEGVGIFCSIFSNRESARRLSIATSALAYQIAEAKDYKEAAKEILGKEKEEEIEKEGTKRTAKKRVESSGDFIDTGTGDQYYVEYYTGAKLKGSPEYIDSCVNDLNALINEKYRYYVKDDLAFSDDQYVKISEWTDILSLKIPHTGLSEVFGWDVTQGLAQLNYSNSSTIMLDNGRSAIILRFSNGNVPDYIDESKNYEKRSLRERKYKGL